MEHPSLKMLITENLEKKKRFLHFQQKIKLTDHRDRNIH